MPDLYITHAAWGIAAWLEVKRPGGKPSKAQQTWHERAQAAGQTVLVVMSGEEAVRLVAALPRRKRA